MKMQQEWCLEGMKEGEMIGNQERESLSKLAKRMVGEEKNLTVPVMEQKKARLQLSFIFCIFRSPEEFRHQLDLLFDRQNS